MNPVSKWSTCQTVLVGRILLFLIREIMSLNSTWLQWTAALYSCLQFLIIMRAPRSLIINSSSPSLTTNLHHPASEISINIDSKNSCKTTAVSIRPPQRTQTVIRRFSSQQNKRLNNPNTLIDFRRWSAATCLVNHHHPEILMSIWCIQASILRLVIWYRFFQLRPFSIIAINKIKQKVVVVVALPLQSMPRRVPRRTRILRRKRGRIRGKCCKGTVVLLGSSS